jgi:DNA invertase Pin-like site-specific DNA recombinase
MMTVGYARISTGDQNVDLQVDALKQAGCRKIFEETASGANKNRPRLAEAIDFLKTGDTLVVWKLDRMARSLSQLIETIDRIHSQGCGFRSITEAIDTTTASGRLTFHIIGALAEFERNIIRERTIAGLRAAAARGRKGGRPKALNNDNLKIAEALLRDGLLTVKEVAKQVGISPATLYKYFPHPREAV